MSEPLLPALHPLQLILRADLSLSPVNKLSEEDEMPAPGGKTRIVTVTRQLCKEWVEVFFSNRKSIIVSASHRFVGTNGRATAAGELTLGTELEGSPDKVTVEGLVRVKGQAQGVFLKTEPNALYFVQGVLSCGS